MSRETDGSQVEHCSECGFVGSAWSYDAAVSRIAELPNEWRQLIDGLDPAALQRRVFEGMWSIAEYTNHVRESMFGMRFLLDVAVGSPGTDLGMSPDGTFSPQPAVIDAWDAHQRFANEVELLCARAIEISPLQDSSSPEPTVIIDAKAVDLLWIVRHALHDVSHHLGDIARLREALRSSK